MVDKPRLPLSDFPDDLVCPECGKQCNAAVGLRGHAFHKHGIKWEAKPAKETSFAKRHGLKEPSELATVEELKPWHKVAIIQKFVFNKSNDAVGRLVGKSGETVKRVFYSPAGEAYVEELSQLMSDNVELLRMAFNSSLLGLAVEDATALEMAKQVQDYEFIHKFVTDHYKITGVIDESKKDVQAQQQAIHLHLDTSTLDIPTVKTEHKVLEVDAEIVDD